MGGGGGYCLVQRKTKLQTPESVPPQPSQTVIEVYSSKMILNFEKDSLLLLLFLMQLTPNRHNFSVILTHLL